MSTTTARTRRARGLCIYCGQHPAVGRTGCRDCLRRVARTRKPHGRKTVHVVPEVYAAVGAVAQAHGLSRAAALELMLGAAYVQRPR